MRLLVSTGGGAERATARLARNAPRAVEKAVLKGSLLLGRMISENVEDFKETVGTRTLSRSFLVPRPMAGGNFILGTDSPIYATIHEYGGTIRPKRGKYLVFQTADGSWHSVEEVTIREKRYARDAIAAFDSAGAFARILGTELAQEFRG